MQFRHDHPDSANPFCRILQDLFFRTLNVNFQDIDELHSYHCHQTFYRYRLNQMAAFHSFNDLEPMMSQMGINQADQSFFLPKSCLYWLDLWVRRGVPLQHLKIRCFRFDGDDDGLELALFAKKDRRKTYVGPCIHDEFRGSLERKVVMLIMENLSKNAGICCADP